MKQSKREPKENQSTYMSIREIADYLSISYQTAKDIMFRELPFVRVGKIYRVRREALMKYLNRLEKRCGDG